MKAIRPFVLLSLAAAVVLAGCTGGNDESTRGNQTGNELNDDMDVVENDTTNSTNSTNSTTSTNSTNTSYG